MSPVSDDTPPVPPASADRGDISLDWLIRLRWGAAARLSWSPWPSRGKRSEACRYRSCRSCTCVDADGLFTLNALVVRTHDATAWSRVSPALCGARPVARPVLLFTACWPPAAGPGTRSASSIWSTSRSRRSCCRPTLDVGARRARHRLLRRALLQSTCAGTSTRRAATTRLHVQGMWVAFVIAALLTAYFVSQLASAVERRDARSPSASARAQRPPRLALHPGRGRRPRARHPPGHHRGGRGRARARPSGCPAAPSLADDAGHSRGAGALPGVLDHVSATPARAGRRRPADAGDRRGRRRGRAARAHEPTRVECVAPSPRRRRAPRGARRRPSRPAAERARRRRRRTVGVSARGGGPTSACRGPRDGDGARRAGARRRAVLHHEAARRGWASACSWRARSPSTWEDAWPSSRPGPGTEASLSRRAAPGEARMTAEPRRIFAADVEDDAVLPAAWRARFANGA